jgi:transcriptional regulator with XRE-family HTH domain
MLAFMTNELPVWRAKRGRMTRGRTISQRDLAKAAGISADRYWRIENDHQVPTPEEVNALARELGTTPAELFPELAEQQQAEAR